MQRRALVFKQPGQIEIRQEQLPAGQPGQVLVEAEMSAISAGTELLFYRGQIPEDMAVDSTLAAISGPSKYPLKYGYQMVGQIIDSKSEMKKALLGARVFAFQPHQSHFWTNPETLIFLPEDLSSQDAVFLPNMETAVNFLHDGRPLLGEKVVVLGQGVVGLLTTSLLTAHPIENLLTVDKLEARRRLSLEMGADQSFDPNDIKKLVAALRSGSGEGQTETADLIYELSGNPKAINTALSLSGYKSRIVLGSWYGTKSAEVEFGGQFHRDRIEIISSQVSSIDPALRGRWTKERRLAAAIDQLKRIQPAGLISHRFELSEAVQAYELLDQADRSVVQVVFAYQI